MRRDRPAVLQLMDVHGFSFPSGHTAAAAACWSAVALVLGRDRPRAVRAVLAGGAALIAIVVATSRALLGVHWVSDVVAGLALGWGWFLLVAVVFGGRTQRLGDPVSDTKHERRSAIEPGTRALQGEGRRMSTANLVPETIGLTTVSGRSTRSASAGAKTLLRDGFQRLRAADGFSHSRAMAFQLVLALIPGTIVLVAIASELRWESLSNAIIRSVESLAPGPTARRLPRGVRSGRRRWLDRIGMDRADCRRTRAADRRHDRLRAGRTDGQPHLRHRGRSSTPSRSTPSRRS